MNITNPDEHNSKKTQTLMTSKPHTPKGKNTKDLLAAFQFPTWLFVQFRWAAMSW